MATEIPRYLREAVLRKFEEKQAELWRELRELTTMTAEAFVERYGLEFDENAPEWTAIVRVAAARFPGYVGDADAIESISLTFESEGRGRPKLYVGFKNGRGRCGGIEGKCSPQELEPPALDPRVEGEKHHG